MGSFSIWHWLIVLVIVLLVFGTKKLRNIGADLGGAVKGFKEGVKGAGDGAEGYIGYEMAIHDVYMQVLTASGFYCIDIG